MSRRLALIAIGLPSLLALTLAALPTGAPATGVPRFVDVTATSGITFVNICGEADQKDYIFEAKGGGVGALDFDNDGWMDIVFAQGSTLARHKAGDDPTPVLYRNRGDGTFEDVTLKAGLTHRGWGMGVSAGDYDNDGWADLYLTYLGQDALYHNNGDGTFTDVTARAGIDAPGWSASAAFGDFDRDGFLDLYVAAYLDVGPDKPPPAITGGACNYMGRPVLCGPRGLPGAADYFFHNNGNGTFSERSEATGALDRGRYYGLGVVAGDLDNDGDLDIYVANDSTPSLLFVNRGNGTFDERGIASGLAYSGDGNEQAGMGVDLADYDNDGWLDAYATHFARDYSTLYRNIGQGIFEDVTRRAGIAEREPAWVSWGTRFVDVNLDGWKDIVHTSGHVYPFLRAPIGNEAYEEPALTLYLNERDGTFSYASPRAGADALTPVVGRGAAFADFDNDGDLDVVIACLNGPPKLFRNDRAPENRDHWLMFRAVGRKSNRDGIGARITVEAGGLKQIWEIKRTVGIYACSDPRAHFGLGGAAKADLVRVLWPSGQTQELRDVAADQHYLLDEGGGLSPEPIRDQAPLAPAVAAPTPAPSAQPKLSVSQVQKLAKQCGRGVQAACAQIAAIAVDEGQEKQLRVAAVVGLTDQGLLHNLARTADPWDLRMDAAGTLKDQALLIDLATNLDDKNVRMTAAERVRDQEVLAKIAVGDPDWMTRENAAIHLEDPALLAKIARGDAAWRVRATATMRIGDQEVLAEIARKDAHFAVRSSAVDRLADRVVLTDIAEGDPERSVRERAQARLRRLRRPPSRRPR